MNEQIDAGEFVIRRALAGGLGLVGGAWAQLDGDSRPYLYVVAPEVESRGSVAAYRAIGSAEKALADEGGPASRYIEWYTVRVIPPSDRLAKGILDHYTRFPDEYPTRHNGSMLGSVYVDGAYIYPAKLFAPQPVGAN